MTPSRNTATVVCLGVAGLLSLAGVLIVPKLINTGVELEQATRPPITQGPQRWCPPVIEDGPYTRVLTRSIWRAPDQEEAALGCFYAPAKPRKQG